MNAAALGWAVPSLVVVGTATASWSVVRYDLRIVAMYTVLAALLATGLALSGRRGRPSPATVPPAAMAVALALAAVFTFRFHAYSYLTRSDAGLVRTVLAAGALAGAALLLTRWRHRADAALAVAIAAYLTASVLLIRLDPAPKIDVWYTLQGAADALAGGHNTYTQTWVGPPGPMAAFTYLPWMGVLTAPGRWLFGDVRWALVAITVAGALALRGFDRRARGIAPARGSGTAAGHGAGAAAGALLLLLPGTATQIEQAWTEPLLLACLAGAALAWRGRRLLLAALLLALGLASKQHLALLIPLLAVWPRLGWRRAAVPVGLAGLLVLPWFLADPRAIVHDTVTLLIDFPPLRFADTLFIAARHELAWTPPFWLTGAIVLTGILAVTWTVRRRDPGVGQLLRWCALVLFVANLVNKQAFYNQYWLVAALVLASCAAADRTSDPAGTQDPQHDPQQDAAPGELTRPAARPADAAV